MALDSSDNNASAGNEPDHPSRSDRSDRIVGRASVPAPRSTEAPRSAPSRPAQSQPDRTSKDANVSREYPSRAYRAIRDQQVPAAPAPRRTRVRWARAAFLVLALAGVISGCGIVVSYLWVRGVDDNLRREDAFASLPARPPKLADGALNILLLGTDSRDPDNAGDPSAAQRSDTMVIAHIPADNSRAYLVSVPRDLWV
ncbi:MAG TPA: hypothetical protein VH395_16825, partial [Jatrophihabitantaceae bacterium]